MDIKYILLVVITIGDLLTRNGGNVRASGCVDLRPDCETFANSGYCEERTRKRAMERLCPRACNVCPDDGTAVTTRRSGDGTVCKDEMQGCSFMLSRGWCEKKKPLMKSRCQKTCKLCDACSDKIKDCIRYKNFGWCERKPDEMAESCPRTCSLCHMVKTKPTPNPVCVDTRETAACEKMKKLDFCVNRASAMEKICKKSCGWCGGSAVKPTTVIKVTTPPTRAPGCVGKDKYGRARCEYYSHIGWCEKHQKIKDNCQDTCVCKYVKPTVSQTENCKDSTYGCCWDNKTAKQNRMGKGCPQSCDDDARFVVLCARFGGDCEGNGGLAKSLQKYCKKTCSLC